MNASWTIRVAEALDAGEGVTVLANAAGAGREMSSLSAEEQARAMGFGRESDRDAFVRGRLLLRAVLRDRLGEGEIPLAFTAKGKPVCSLPGAPGFNVSHAGGKVAVAFGPWERVGVDLEWAGRRPPVERLARRCFGPEERAACAGGDAEGFLRVWTRKEARVKAEGTGLSVKLSRLDTFEEERAGRWVFHPFRTEDGYLGCVAHPPPGVGQLILDVSASR